MELAYNIPVSNILGGMVNAQALRPKQTTAPRTFRLSWALLAASGTPLIFGDASRYSPKIRPYTPSTLPADVLHPDDAAQVHKPGFVKLTLFI